MDQQATVPFDPIKTPINPGLTLLEAGAGTGKTYSLVRVIARLLIEKKIPIREILAVTFTRAATAEIKSRLHAFLSEVLSELKSSTVEAGNDLAKRLLTQDTEVVEEAKRHIAIALAEFDCAPIFTIDGCFQRLLSEYAFEAGIPFSVELETDESAVIDTALRDYWRQHVYPLKGEMLKDFRRNVRFEKVTEFVREALRNHPVRLAPEYFEDPAIYRTELARQWPIIVEMLGTHRDELEAFVMNPPPGIKKSRSPFRKDTTGKFLAAVAGHLKDPGCVPASIGALGGISGSILFKEEAFNAGKFNDLSQHALAPLFKAIAEFELATPPEGTVQSAYFGAIYRFVCERIEQLKSARGVETYSGITNRLASLLDPSSASAQQMKQAAGTRYRAVLIDEFQDTSPQQCAVFLSLFHSPECFFYIIGDPKQSIYRFRGADVFSYIRAKQQADHSYNLLVNYRSSPRMIHAVNTLFEMSPDPFLLGDCIDFQAAWWPDTRTLPDGPEALVFHEVELKDPKADSTRRAIARSIVSQIAQLVGNPWQDYAAGTRQGQLPGHEQIEASDIAILVRSAKEAGPIADLLTELGIPVATSTSSSLLESNEASEVLVILTALLEPSNAGALRSALLQPALGSGGHLNDEGAFDAITSKIAELHTTWRSRGLLPAILHLIEHFDVLPRLLGLSQGQRRLTNFMHLVELLDSKAREERLTPAAIVQWLTMAINGSVVDMDSEVLELRIATDKPAVQIRTQHSSKGLEFPIVFVTPPCPQDYTKLKPGLAYHDEGTLQACIAAIDDPKDSQTYALRRNETSAEYARLAYVAMTRAQFRCHLYHLPVNPKKPEEHAIHQMLGCPDAEMLEALCGQSQGTILRAPVDDDVLGPLPKPEQSQQQENRAQLQVRSSDQITITRRERTTSFSGITRLAEEAGDILHDFDAATGATDTTMDSGFWTHLQAGASLGNAFHEIFEAIDFQNPGNVATLIDQKLQTYAPWRLRPGPKLLKELVAQIETFIVGLMKHPISGNLTLDQVAPGSRLIEAQFLLSGTDFSLPALCDILTSDPPEYLPGGYVDELMQMRQHTFTGFLAGFIDLVFEHDGRFHLLDWKTNRIPDNSPETLAGVMAEHHYFLQYHLYTLALDRLLSQRLGGNYDPARHLGNVYYLFLRGVEPGVPTSGVFTDSLSARRLEALRCAFREPARALSD